MLVVGVVFEVSTLRAGDSEVTSRRENSDWENEDMIFSSFFFFRTLSDSFVEFSSLFSLMTERFGIQKNFDQYFSVAA